MARFDMFSWLRHKAGERAAQVRKRREEEARREAEQRAAKERAAAEAQAAAERAAAEKAAIEKAQAVAAAAAAPAPVPAPTPALQVAAAEPTPHVPTVSDNLADAAPTDPPIAPAPRNAEAQTKPLMPLNEQKRVVHVLAKVRKEPKPSAGMPAYELAPPKLRKARIVAVKAGGRRLLAKVAGAERTYTYALRKDGTYRLAGAPQKTAPRLLLDLDAERHP